MTKVKIKGKAYSAKGQVGWFKPALWITSAEIDFNNYVVMINDKTYTTWSPKFKKAFDDDRLIRMLQQ